MIKNLQDIILPELGEGVTQGELIKWLVSKGDTIDIDQNVVEIMTDKAAMEVPSPIKGVVHNILAKPGDMISIGQSMLTVQVPSNNLNKKLANVESQDTSQSVDNLEFQDVANIESQDTSQSVDNLKSQDVANIESQDTSQSVDNLKSQDTTQPVDSSSVLATPFTRRLATQLGINLNQVLGSGLAGRVTKLDVLKKSPTSPQAEASTVIKGFSISADKLQQRQPLTGIRKKIAQKMQKAKAVIPHFTLVDSVNIEPLEELKNTVKKSLEEKQIKVTYLSFIMKTLFQVIKEFPEINASIDDIAQEIVIKNYYNFGFAVDTSRGLLVPVIKNVDQKSIAEISSEIQTLALQARDGNIKLEDMQQGTITITNIGSLGGEHATPIINAPEVSILGMYRIYVKPIWDGSQFKPQKTMNFSFTCDHRLIDGAVSAKVMKSFIHKIENPLSVFI